MPKHLQGILVSGSKLVQIHPCISSAPGLRGKRLRVRGRMVHQPPWSDLLGWSKCFAVMWEHRQRVDAQEVCCYTRTTHTRTTPTTNSKERAENRGDARCWQGSCEPLPSPLVCHSMDTGPVRNRNLRTGLRGRSSRIRAYVARCP